MRIWQKRTEKKLPEASVHFYKFMSKLRIFQNFQLPFHETLLGASPKFYIRDNLHSMGLRTSLWGSFFPCARIRQKSDFFLGQIIHKLLETY